MNNSDLPIRDQLAIWRQKVIDGTITDEEAEEAVRVMRAGRLAAAEAGEKRGSKAPRPNFDSDAILDA
ncbi:MAG TPA: hypothetical protein VNS88_17750 [Nitrospiraceae bacterium]|nr:hypothetical protein [Nitrospiraceae bacterium]